MSGIAEERRMVPLRPGLSIGSDVRNAIVIDHPDVRPIHATVWETPNGLLLDCASGAAVVLRDRAEAAGLVLIAGTRCRIGDVLLTCVEQAGTDPDAASDLGHCVRCALHLDDLPAARRFCPRCGLSLPAKGSNAAAHSAPAHVLPLRENEPDHSPIIAGYATAMNKLGVRYEAGQGVARNEDEAIRCYGKAARLGNDDARTRLEQL
jgi:hypothetical protein